ncbi:uncharacterized protein G2W53_035314 [Senna tora]|uniref:B box-type domain-containing protein n=1 Tax=Senna tora TaxID=362788 RepID=A0A834SS26_9FABA|nr:uncharacterized protein G2W53_035314 [Senna tora]
MVGHSLVVPEERKSESDWLNILLHSNFGHCDDHQDLRYNEKNVFCIDCKISLCRHCKEAHGLHRRLEREMSIACLALVVTLMIISFMTYISNNEKIIHLNPRLSSKSTKATTKRDKSVDLCPQFQSQDHTKMLNKSKSGGTCEECGKHLQDERNCFCSISCKISVEPKSMKSPKPEVSDHSSLNENQNSETESSSISEAEPYEWVEVVNLRKRPRKAIPHRSPFVLIS